MQIYESIRLDDPRLIGKHTLTAVDNFSASVKAYPKLDNCQVLNFELDGVTYTAVEDPDDGYRSMLGDIIVTNYKVPNQFPPIVVEGSLGTPDRPCLLVLSFCGKPVVTLGTDNSEDYYPSFVADFQPENMIFPYPML